VRIETSHRESSQGDEMYLRSASSMHCAPATEAPRSSASVSEPVPPPGRF
jgi:hypothetical protein